MLEFLQYFRITDVKNTKLLSYNYWRCSDYIIVKNLCISSLIYKLPYKTYVSDFAYF